MATVMVIDDSRATRALAKQTLVEAGYNVVEATDPGDALNKARLAKVDVFVCFTAQPVELPGRAPADQSGKMIDGPADQSRKLINVASLQPAQLLATIRKALA